MPQRPVFAEPLDVTNPEDCFFYHTIEIPGVGVFPGCFDLRQTVGEYLGGVSFEGKQVLEAGPANGFLTFHMEQQGAEMTVVDVSKEFFWDTVPYPREKLETWIPNRWPHMLKIRNAFWFAHHELESSARVHYGSAYAIPEELGEFDTSVMAMMLLHNRDPLKIVQSCAQVTRETVVIVDQYDEELAKTGWPTMSLVPTAENQQLDTWWHISPTLLQQFLAILGFTDIELTTHVQKWRTDPQEETMSLEMPCFTLVARR